MICLVLLIVFFFKQKTAYEMRISDWSSDVCSSDLDEVGLEIYAPLGLADRERAGKVAVAEHPLHARQFPDFVFISQSGRDAIGEIGRASCRERVCQYV